MFRVLPSLVVSAILLIAIPGTWAQTGKGEAPAEVKGATTVDVAMAKMLWDDGVSFVDVRNLDLWEKGRIPGATFLDFFTEFTETSLAKVAKTNDKVVIYCGGPG